MNILITGGSSGLGKSLVEELSKDKKNHIYFSYNRSDKSALKICEENKNTSKIRCDFNDEMQLNVFIKKLKTFNLDVLINNYYSWPENPLLPGTFLNRHFHKIDEKVFIEEFEKNIIPTIKITQEIIKLFRIKKTGKILTTLTSFLESPTIGSSVYLSNKNYLKSLCDIWRIENKKYNITSHYFSPSFMITEHTSKMDDRLIDQMINSTKDKKIMTVHHVSKKISQFLNEDTLTKLNEIIL
tara:strand:+ start:794 stop:1516 length:723 start_codon:yes stop_codon:yes gene_type:complete